MATEAEATPTIRVPNMPNWRYSAGWPGRNLVTVYERYEGGPIQIEMWPNGRRKRASLRDLNGAPIRDKELAQQIADLIAAKVNERQHQDDVRALLGIRESHTLDELSLQRARSRKS